VPITSQCAIALLSCVFFTLGASSFLYATHVTSGAGATNRPAGMEKAGGFTEVARGPRGKNEIALTFDAGAEAECFDDLITALANARLHCRRCSRQLPLES
jgi:hypothetical protein